MLKASDSEWLGPHLERNLAQARQRLSSTLTRVACYPTLERLDAAVVRFRHRRVESAAVNLTRLSRSRTPFSEIANIIEDLERGN